MSMSGSNSPLVRPLVVMLVVGVIGVYALYSWYTGQLTKQLGEKDATIAEQVEQQAESDRSINDLKGEIAQLEGRLRDLADAHSDERQGLAERLSIAQQANAELQRGIASLHLTDTDAIAAEQARTAVVIAERDRAQAALETIEAKYEAALERLAALKAELNGLGQIMADLASEHRAQIATLERHLNERVTLAKTTPKESELLRVAQAAGLLPESVVLDDDRAALEERLAQLERETQAEREAMQAEADAARTQYREQLEALEAELQAARAAVETARAQGMAALEAAQTEHRSALADAESRLAASNAGDEAAGAEPSAEVADMRTRLERAETALAQATSDAEAALAAGTADLQRRLQEGEAKVADLTEQLARAQNDAAERAEVQQRAAQELNAALEAANGELERVREELATTVTGADTEADTERTKALDEAQARIRSLESAIEDERRAVASAHAAAEREAQTQVSDLRSLYRRFSALGGIHTDRGMLLTLGEAELRFATGTSTLPSGDLPSLDQIAALLDAHADLKVRIEGYTDSQGDAQTNRVLSRARAEAVKDALLARGVAAERVTAEGMGADRPVADNATSAGRAQNRRVEVYVVEG
jgi:outer membrane protein OmpA-like peptidoglycan-associated protein